MKVEIREIKPQPPPREVVITMSEEEAQRIYHEILKAECETNNYKGTVLPTLNKLRAKMFNNIG